MAPQKAMRPKLFMRSKTAWKILPPTFSKSLSMPLRAELVEHGAVVALGAMVEAGVVARLAHRPMALVLVAGAAHDLRAGELGELARHLADRAGRGRDERRLARLGLADVLHAVPGGEGRHAEHAEIGLQRRAAGVDLAQALAVMDRVARPVQQAHHRVALGERGLRDSTTSPTEPPVSGWSISNGGT